MGTNKKPLLFAKLKTKSRNSLKLEMFDSQSFSNVNYDNTYSYSVLRLRSQPTIPTPMLPSRTAPGAGMT